MPRRITITRALSRRSPLRGAESDATAQEARAPRVRIGCGCLLVLLLALDLTLRAICHIFTAIFNS